MNPYNNNPFENNEPRELRNERDANRELAKTVNAAFRKELNDSYRYSDEFGGGILTGMATLANELSIVLDTDNLIDWFDYNRKRA